MTMSEPTRDDLRWIEFETVEDYLADFDQEGLVFTTEEIALAWLRERVNPTCPECGGDGWLGTMMGGGSPKTCPRCDGRGRLGVDLDDLRVVVESVMFRPDIETKILCDAARALLDLLGEEES